MTHPCPDCGKPARRHGQPQLHGYFIDQMIVCSKCDWCGVETECRDEGDVRPVQLELFKEK